MSFAGLSLVKFSGVPVPKIPSEILHAVLGSPRLLHFEAATEMYCIQLR